MPHYRCTFINDRGQSLKRVVFADSRQDLFRRFGEAEEKLLRAHRLYFYGISFFRLFSQQVGYTEFLLFNQKMITLLQAGVSFVRALGIIINDTSEGSFKQILSRAESDIRNGVQISDAFNSSQIPFHVIYRASLLAGERSGNLVSVLEKFNYYLEKVTRLRRKTISSLTYPVILLVFMLGMVLLILLYAIPRFSSFYENFDASLPSMTLTLISVATFLQRNFFWFLAGAVTLFAVIKLIERLWNHVVIIDFLKLKIPFVGTVIRENGIAVFSRTLAILIAGGIPVPEAAGIAVGTFSNRYFKLKTRDIPVRIKAGNVLSDALEEVVFIPAIMVEIIRVGESSGNLTAVLNKNADYYENSIDIKISLMVSLIEPVLIIFLGGVIAFMLISVYLPIFQSIRVIR